MFFLANVFQGYWSIVGTLSEITFLKDVDNASSTEEQIIDLRRPEKKRRKWGKLCIKHFQNTLELGALEAPSSCISLDTPFKIYGQFRYFMI